MDEDNAAVIHALGQIEEALGDARAAAATYARGVSANPTDAHLLQSLARLEAQVVICTRRDSCTSEASGPIRKIITSNAVGGERD